MEIDQTVDSISSKIRVDGIIAASFSIQFRDIGMSHLAGKINYIKSLASYSNRRQSVEKKSRNRVSTVDVFKQLLVNVYISDAIFMASTLRSIIERNSLRGSLDQIWTQQIKGMKNHLILCLKEIFKRHRNLRMNEFFYRLTFQPKKKSEHVQEVMVSPRRRTTVLQFAPSAPRKVLTVKPTLQVQKTVLPNILNSLHLNTNRELTLHAFKTLFEKTGQKNWTQTVPLKNMCRIIIYQLQQIFSNIKAYSHFNYVLKKTSAAFSYQYEIKSKNLMAERVKNLHLQFEALSSSKLIDGKKHQTIKANLQDAVVSAEQEVALIEHKLTSNQERFQVMLDALDRKKRRNNSVDYFPVLKKLYIQHQEGDSQFIKKSQILKKYKIQLDSLIEWPQVQLSTNIYLKKQLMLYEGQLCPSALSKSNMMPAQYEGLEKDVIDLKEFISGYITDHYRYKILERLRLDYNRLEKQYNQINGLAKKNDIVALRKIFGME